MKWFGRIKRRSNSEFIEQLFWLSGNAANTIDQMSKGIDPNWNDQQLKALFESWPLRGDPPSEKSIQPLTELQWFRIVFEFLFFYLHITDRFAFDCEMDELKRAQFMNNLEKEAISFSVDNLCKSQARTPKKVSEMKSDLVGEFRHSMLLYGGFQRLMSEGKESPKDTLFWEFGKMIAKLADREFDVRYIAACVHIIISSLPQLDIKEFVHRQ